ncbi:MAG: hypothetical protein DME99_12215 [Verrucomicrobia bacterium]|nr:MAG: hypothetical protein DME99_12215 [Verrucomicrobiota bacterium]
MHRTRWSADARGRRRAIHKLDRRGSGSWFVGSNQKVWLFSRTVSPNTQRNSGKQTRRGRADRLPGFQFAPGPRVAEGVTATKGNIQQKVIYYISPQVWAWNRGRIKKMSRFIDLVLCIFPFEADLYNQSGLRALFVGHPMIERLQAQKIDTERDPNLIGLFPGSRLREVRKIFPVMIQTLRELQRHNQNLRFEVAAASAELAREMSPLIEGRGEGEGCSATRSPSNSNQSRRNSRADAARVCRNRGIRERYA